MDWFARQLLAWFDDHGRKDLPWQQDTTAYRVWVSEIMLQQTQVTTVIDYYQRFMTSFPTVVDLAAASQDQVLHHWTGLGYYARARNLHKTAKIVATDHNGEFPLGVEALEALPGIGRSTAGAIAAIAQDQHASILDGNVKRVLARYHAVRGHPSKAETAKRLWYHADAHTPKRRTAHFTQAIMDLGATLCKRSKPLCLTEPAACPLVSRCEAYATSTQADFPEKKQAKVKPVRAARMWLLHTDDGLCLLEQRSTDGLWGGLWTPPERPLEVELPQLARELGIDLIALGEPQVQETFRHTFSHYHLDVTPVFVALDRPPNLVADNNRTWYDSQAKAPELGLAKPAVTLLAQLAERVQSRQTRVERPKGSKVTDQPRKVFCRKFLEEMEGLESPPMPGPKGEELFETVSKKAWEEWQALQTMLINEKHLNMREPESRKYLTEQRERFLDNLEVDRAEGYVEPDS